MSNIKGIFIELDNLTDEEQLKLWDMLWFFADRELRPHTNLEIMVLNKDIVSDKVFSGTSGEQPRNKRGKK